MLTESIQHWLQAHSGRSTVSYKPMDSLAHSKMYSYDMDPINRCTCASSGVNCLGGHLDTE